MRRRNAIRTLLTYIVLIALAIWAITALDSTTTKEMSYTELMQKIETEDVKSIELGTTRLNAKVILKDEENITRIVDIPSSSTFIESVQDRVASGQFELTVAQETVLETLAPYIPNVLLLLGTLFVLMFVLRKTNDSNNKAMDFGKSRAQKIDKNSPKKVTFKDVAGLDE